MVAGYTYAHALDDVGANWDFGYGAGLPQDSYNVGREYASSDFDIRHRLTLSLDLRNSWDAKDSCADAGRMGTQFHCDAGEFATVGSNRYGNGCSRSGPATRKSSS